PPPAPLPTGAHFQQQPETRPLLLLSVFPYFPRLAFPARGSVSWPAVHGAAPWRSAGTRACHNLPGASTRTGYVGWASRPLAERLAAYPLLCPLLSRMAKTAGLRPL